MRLIDYSQVEPGQLIMFENLPNNYSLVNSCLVCGIVMEAKPERLTLASRISHPNSELEELVFYYPKRIKDGKIGLTKSADQFRSKNFIGDNSQLSKGDLVLVRYSVEEDELGAYLGFINRLNHDQIMVRNYLANLKEPFRLNRSQMAIHPKLKDKYAYLILESSISLSKHFDFDFGYGKKKSN